MEHTKLTEREWEMVRAIRAEAFATMPAPRFPTEREALLIRAAEALAENRYCAGYDLCDKALDGTDAADDRC